MRKGCSHCHLIKDEDTGNEMLICVGLCTRLPYIKEDDQTKDTDSSILNHKSWMAAQGYKPDGTPL